MKNVPWIIIALLLLVILYLRECSPKPECPPPIVRVDTIPGDTIIHYTIINKPRLVYRDTGSSRWYREKIDTVAILAACMAVNHYRDTLKNDSSALVIIENEVSMNELQRTRMEFLNRRTFIVIDKFNVPDQKNIDIYGGLITTNQLKIQNISISAIFVNKRRMCWVINYQPFNKIFEFGVMMKICK